MRLLDINKAKGEVMLKKAFEACHALEVPDPVLVLFVSFTLALPYN